MLLKPVPADLRSALSQQRREGVVAIDDQACVQDGDSALFHLLDEKPIGAVRVRHGVNLLAKRAFYHHGIDFAATDTVERFFGIAKPCTQIIQFGFVAPSGNSPRAAPGALVTGLIRRRCLGPQAEAYQHLFRVREIPDDAT